MGVAAYATDPVFPIPEMNPQRTDLKPLEFVDIGGKKIPSYPKGAQWGTQEEAISKMQKPLSPEESLKHFVVPKGFRVELFASEPMIGGKPICMNWDEQGRLWIAETYDYPNELQPEGKGRDRIRILADTNGDGRADKATVFAEKLSIPTSLIFHDGGVIVQDGNKTRYFKDTNGDDVADESSVLFDGWAMGDTHGGVSNFHYGLDNWIWAMQGYNNSQPQNSEFSGQRFRQGFMRFRADGSEVEFIRSTNNNTWGLGFNEEGIVFGSTANGNPSIYMPIPNRYYERVRGWTPSLVLENSADTYKFAPITENVRQVDRHGGYTAGAGHALYTARRYPKEYWNRTTPAAGIALVAMLQTELRYQDRWLADAAISAAAANDTSFLTALSLLPGNVDQELVDIIKIVSEHYARGGESDSLGAIIAATAKSDPIVADSIIFGLAKGWPVGTMPNLDAAMQANLQAIADRLEPASRGSFVKLARGWGSKKFDAYAEKVSKELLARVDDVKLNSKDRLASVREFIMFRPKDDEAVTELLGRVTPQLDPRVENDASDSLRGGVQSHKKLVFD